MCGIAGLLVEQGVADGFVVRKMTERMSHRGPDAEAVFSNGPVSLGHRRLSIIDLSTSANQPFHSEDGRYVIVFNGEIYNYREVNLSLQHRHFRTSSDTETVIHAFAEWGIEAVSRFKGMFAFAIWDSLEEKLTLVRDRFGVKPLYYSNTGKGFLFASEVRAILASGMVKREICEDGLYEYIKFQSVGYPHSMIKNVKQLGAGEFMEICRGEVRAGRYWDIFNVTALAASTTYDQVKREVKGLLLKSVERRLVADVPVGAFLSGGIDSSAIVGLMAQVSSEPVRTFNVYFDEEEYSEQQYAEIIAKKFGTVHTGIKMEPSDFLNELDAAFRAVDSPSADGVNTFVVSKAIRNAGITVALSGLGGDELFAGYPIFSQFKNLHKYSAAWKGTSLLRRMVSLLVTPSSNRRQRLKEILSVDDLDISNVYPVSRSLLSREQVKNFTKLTYRKTALEIYLDQHRSAFSSFTLNSQVTLAELAGYTQQTLLKDTDQMSMAVSLEVREPFFDHDLIQYVLSIPDHFKMQEYPKQLLVESLGDLLPGEVVHRKKKGFSFPWKIWLRRELAGFCTSRLESITERDFMNGKELLNKWSLFLRGDESMRWAEFWAFVVLEDWLRQNDVN